MKRSSYYQSIPSQTESLSKKKGYRHYPIDLNNPHNQELLIDIKTIGIAGDNYYARTRNNPPYNRQLPYSIDKLWLRKSVTSKLLVVNQKLATFGLELHSFDCWRPIKLQKYLANKWFPDFLKKQNPTLSPQVIKRETGRYFAKVARITDHLSPPPHYTGAATDLTIRNHKTNEHLFMGSIFDDCSPISYLDHFERLSKRKKLNISEQTALLNRRLLYWTMIEHEFIINPTEWWHCSWGDQMWAKLSDHNTAFYSGIEPVTTL